MSPEAISPPLLAGQARPGRLLFSILAYVDLASATAALGADNARAKPRHFSLGWISRYIDQTLVSAGVVQAGRKQPLHAELAHVAERHRRAGGCFGFTIA